MRVNVNGGVAQLGEHLPCKQGVKSSNLSISIRNPKGFRNCMYLENCILKYTLKTKVFDDKTSNRKYFQE